MYAILVLFQPQRGEVTFHLPLHRHLAAFISLVSKLGRLLIIPPMYTLSVIHGIDLTINLGSTYHCCFYFHQFPLKCQFLLKNVLIEKHVIKILLETVE